MKTKEKLSLHDIDALVFDFDGVLTNNRVLVNENGDEWVMCNRGDGLAFNELNTLGIKSFIISAEKNSVVATRAKKLNVPVLYGVSNKTKALDKIIKKEGFNISRILYIGNDLNDYEVMKQCGYSACPVDSNNKIKKLATFVLRTKGGSGIVREIIDEILNINTLELIYFK